MVSSRLRTALALSVTLAVLLGVPFDTLARGSGRSHAYTPRSSSSASSHRSTLSSSRSSNKCESCSRDSQGKIKRDPNAKSEFKRTNPKPPGCDHCEVDHIVPLSKGGRDDPSNMQWLPKAQHQDKTKRDLRP
jgi:5-methylcytosine-specific restriction endonuclease McrA